MRAFRLAAFRLIAITAWTIGPAAGALSAQPTPAGTPARRGPTDPAELEAFLDGVLTAQLAAHHIAGATVTVVRDGRVLLAKGYGFADVEARKPVDPDRTLFRIGSVSKLFTWTAVMQLVEQGQLDLDADIETYLDFSIPDTYPQPITLRHLLAHTPGFEDDNRGMEVLDPADLDPMSEWLPAHLPARVRPPGAFSAYSNWGAAAAGYIVERVSGLPFEEYLEQRILTPLGMTRTTGRQPLPDRFREDVSRGYAWEGGAFVAKASELANGVAPAASMSSTASDMAKWMLVHLNHGQLGDARLFSDATAELMHRRSFGHDPRVNGWALGFYEKSSHGLRIIGHGGGSRWFHTDLALIPEERLGIFVSYNTGTGGEVVFGPFLNAVLDHYYTAPPPSPVAHADLDRFAGTYRFNRTSPTTFQKALSLPGVFPIRALGDSALLATLPFGESHFVPIDEMLFQERAGPLTLAFRAGESGQITHAFLSLTPMMVLERQPWHAGLRLHLTILVGGFIVFGMFLVAVVARWLRRRRGVETASPAPLATGRRVLAGAALANLLFAGLLFVALSNEATLLSDTPRILQVALALPVIALVLVLMAAWVWWRLWRQRVGTGWERGRFAAVVLAGLLFAWSLNYWNLLGWRM